MNVDMLAALREKQDLVLTMPCGVLISVPAEVMQAWSVTPASPELIQFAGEQMGKSGKSLAMKGDGATPILDVLIQMLPTLCTTMLPVLLPLLVTSISKPTTTTVATAPKNDPPKFSVPK